MESHKIAVVQMSAVVNQVEANLAKMTQFILQAVKEQVDIICFPELSVNCYSRERSHETAETIPGPSSNYLLGLAMEHGITIVAGMVEEYTGNKPYNTHFVAFPDGRIERYRKTHLGISEKKYFSPGTELPTFTDKKVNFGIQICWEMHFPEITTVLSINGCELVFAPHASPVTGSERREIWLKYLAARAYDNSVYIAACNLVGYDGEKQDFGGGSMIIDPKGNVISECFHGEEAMITATLESSLINKIRTQRSQSMRNSFYLMARRPELYGDIVKGVSPCESEKS